MLVVLVYFGSVVKKRISGKKNMLEKIINEVIVATLKVLSSQVLQYKRGCRHMNHLHMPSWVTLEPHVPCLLASNTDLEVPMENKESGSADNKCIEKPTFAPNIEILAVLKFESVQ